MKKESDCELRGSYPRAGSTAADLAEDLARLLFLPKRSRSGRGPPFVPPATVAAPRVLSGAKEASETENAKVRKDHVAA